MFFKLISLGFEAVYGNTAKYVIKADGTKLNLMKNAKKMYFSSGMKVIGESTD